MAEKRKFSVVKEQCEKKLKNCECLEAAISEIYKSPSFLSSVKESLSKEENREFGNGARVISKPFHCCILPNFLKSKEFIRHLKDDLSKLEMVPKETDLYQFKQSQDFTKSIGIHIDELRSFLYGKCLSLVSEIMKVSLTDEVDMTCACYENTDFLLCHDDQLEGRSVAFIYYLCENWEKEDGGSLDLFDSENGNPLNISESVVPNNNLFVFFKVSSRSFHQVAEVMKDKRRISISGWFHSSESTVGEKQTSFPSDGAFLKPVESFHSIQEHRKFYIKDEYFYRLSQEVFHESTFDRRFWTSAYPHKSDMAEVGFSLMLIEGMYLTVCKFCMHGVYNWKRHNNPFLVHLMGDIKSWINPDYLQPHLQIQIRKKFISASQIHLPGFLQEDKYLEICDAFKFNKLKWKTVGPSNKRQYEEGTAFPKVVKEFITLLQSESMCVILSNITNLALHENAIVDSSDNESDDTESDSNEFSSDEEISINHADSSDWKKNVRGEEKTKNIKCLKKYESGTSYKSRDVNSQKEKTDRVSTESPSCSNENSITKTEKQAEMAEIITSVRKWKNGYYTLLHDHCNQEASLHIFMHFCCEEWKEEFGGYVTYVAADNGEELLRVDPKRNTLALVYADTETHQFVKYINNKITKQTCDSTFYDISASYYERFSTV